jgi:diaminopimelate epimerase
MERGSLTISWAENGHVLMTGPASRSFTGTIDLP